MHSQLPHLLSTLCISSSPSSSVPTPHQQQNHHHQERLQLESLDENGEDTPRALWATKENEQGSRKVLVGHDGYRGESVHRSNKEYDGVDDDGDVDMEMEREDVTMEDASDGDENINNNKAFSTPPHPPPSISTFTGRILKPKINKQTPNPQPSPERSLHRARDGTLISTPHQPPIPTFTGRNLKPKINKQTPNPQPRPERLSSHRARDGTLTSTSHQTPISTFTGRSLKPKIDKRSTYPERPWPHRARGGALTSAPHHTLTQAHALTSTPSQEHFHEYKYDATTHQQYNYDALIRRRGNMR